MTAMNSNIAELAELLHETEQHHSAYEQSAPKHNWWDWYAAYLRARQHGRTPEQATGDATQYMDGILEA